MVWCGLVWHGMVWYGLVGYGMVWCGMVWHGMFWYGMAWYVMLWYGMVWSGICNRTVKAFVGDRGRAFTDGRVEWCRYVRAVFTDERAFSAVDARQLARVRRCGRGLRQPTGASTLDRPAPCGTVVRSRPVWWCAGLHACHGACHGAGDGQGDGDGDGDGDGTATCVASV